MVYNMLARSSSTPVGRTYLTSFSDYYTNLHSPTNLPFLHFSKVKPRCSFIVRACRRVLSNSHLVGFSSEFSGSEKKMLEMPEKISLDTAPSFSVFNSTNDFKDVVNNCKADQNLLHSRSLQRSVTIGDGVEPEFSFEKNQMSLTDEECEKDGDLVDPNLYPASGVGIDKAGFKYAQVTEAAYVEASLNRVLDQHPSHPTNKELNNIEDHLKMLVSDNPANPLLLRNYAQFLHQYKGDLLGALEWYSRAILADPGDGEVLALYATLIWEVHHDKDKAESYFEQAAESAPQNSHVVAAYASFLWETAADDKDEDDQRAQQPIASRRAARLFDRVH